MAEPPALHREIRRAASRGDADAALLASAQRLYGLLTGGAESLGYNVQGAPSLTEEGPDGRRRVVDGVLELEGAEDRAAKGRQWRRARTLKRGQEVPRLFNPYVLARHIGGSYSVAPEAAGWVQWAILDIDAKPDPRDGSEAVAKGRARAVAKLADVWRVFGFHRERQPVVWQTPGGGFHVYLPLTRGPSSVNPEHTWPAAWVRAWIALHLREAGLELRDGELELYPSRRPIRAPAGARMQLLQATRPDEPDDLGLVPWPGTRTARGRDVGAMVAAFCDAFEERRMTLAALLGRPEAEWDRSFGFFAWRRDPAPSEKPEAPLAGGEHGPSQQIDDVPAAGGGGISGRDRRTRRRDPAASLAPDRVSTPPVTPDPDQPPDVTGALTKGDAFRRKVLRLLTDGLTSPGTRHDAVLTLVFYWGATHGLSRAGVLDRVERWCTQLPHAASVTRERQGVAAFTATCLAEAASYFDAYASRWPFRGRGGGVACAPLSSADHQVLAAIDPRVRDEAGVVLSWLAGNADREGRVLDPVELAHGLLGRLCGDRRVVDGGKRRRAVVLVLEELLRLGVVTTHAEYAVGRHGRVFSCWYQFGSGRLPEALGVAQPMVSAAVPADADRRESASVAPCEPQATALVLASREVPEGVLRALSDGSRAPARVVLEVRDAALVTPLPGGRPPWWARLYVRWFSVGEFLHADPSVVPLPGRRRPRPVYRWAREMPAPRVASSEPSTPTALTLAVPAALVAALPGDLAHVLAGAWSAFERRR